MQPDVRTEPTGFKSVSDSGIGSKLAQIAGTVWTEGQTVQFLLPIQN